MIKLVVILSLLIGPLLGDAFKPIVIFLSIMWAIYTIYQFIKIEKFKDKKITTDKDLLEPPNNNYSAYIRYLYKGKVDYKAFVASIIELMLRKSISLVRYNKGDYYLINNKDDEELSKCEECIKKILFKDIGNSDSVSLNLIKEKCSKNSGYIYSVYKEWEEILEYECASNKYFITNKNIVENVLLYFIISFIISLYHLIFTNIMWLAVSMIGITGYLCKCVNDIRNREEDAKRELEKWLEFKNYINKQDNNLDELDVTSLENYATYAYVLDCYEGFINVLNRKHSKNTDSFKDSVLLMIMYLRIFDEFDNVLKTSINKAFLNSKILFSRNKGRR